MVKTRKSRKNFIIGKNCLREVLESQPQRLISIYSSHPKHDSLLQEFAKHKIYVSYVERKGLDVMAGSTSHQGYVAEVRDRAPCAVEDILEAAQQKTKSIVLMLDSIFDPQNMGAILRASECFGADGVILSKNRGCSITSTVTKTSVGASELVPIAQVSNLATTMQKMQQAGFWSVSAELSDKATKLSEFEYPEKTLLVLGSEGRGVQQLISKKADFHVYIPMKGRIDSLNVSQAASVFLYHYNYCRS